MSSALRPVSHMILAASLLPAAILNGATAAEPLDAERGATLTGRVVDADGRPVAGADVGLRQYGKPGDRTRATTDKSGSYRFERLADGHYVLVASAPGLARSFRATPVERGGELVLEIVLGEAVVPIVELRDEQDRPVPGARLRDLSLSGDNGRFFLRRMDWDTFGITAEPSDAAGRLRLPPLPEGTILTATFDHHRQAPVRIRDVLAADGTIATAKMQRGVPLTLRIHSDKDDETVSDLSLQLFHDPSDHPSTILADRIAVRPDGTAAIAIEAGEYDWLRLEHEDFFVTPTFIPRRPLRIEAGQNDQLSFHLHRKVQVRGRVIDVTTGRPLGRMDIQGEIANDPRDALIVGNDWSHADWGESNDQGEYTVALAPGRVRLSFKGDRYIAEQDSIELDVAADGSTVAPAFKVRLLPKIVGRVLDPAGGPVPRAIVRFRGRRLAWTQPVLTDERGRFELQPPSIPVDPEAGTRLTEQLIVAFHPYEPLSGVIKLRLDDPEAVSKVRLRLEERDYGSVLTDFLSEMPSRWQQGDTSDVADAADRLAHSLKGRPAPELDGLAWFNTERSQMSLADFRGRYVLLDFWFIECGPCHVDFPSVKLVHELYKDHGVTVIGVHRNSATPEAVRAHVEKIGLPFPIVVDRPDGRIVAAYKAHDAVLSFPSYVLIGPDGEVVHVDRTVPAPNLRFNKLEIIRLHAMGNGRTRSELQRHSSN